MQLLQKILCVLLLSFSTAYIYVPHCMIYGYTDNLVIAEVENALLNEVAYSSFEDNTSGNWTFSAGGVQTTAGVKAITGKKYYALSSGNITKAYSPAPAKNIIVSYWSRSTVQNVNGVTGQAGRVVTIDGFSWTFYEHLLINPTAITISGTGIIDELRSYPEDASMTSYSYEPFVGIINKCDINNNIIYYEYDIFNRVSLTKDQDQRILKKFCYGNAGQQEDCSGAVFQSAIKTGSFTRSDCGVGFTGSSVTYTVPAGTYISSVDQATATQMAQTDYDANGPVYANINGSCSITVVPPSITGITSLSYGLPNGSGTITSSPGYLVTVTISASGAPPGVYSLTMNITGGVTMTRNVSNSSLQFTFTMPASGSVNWNASFTAPNSAGSGSISVS